MYLIGFLIYGMGGMGKISLVVEGCCWLYIEDKWSVYKIDLRYEECWLNVYCYVILGLIVVLFFYFLREYLVLRDLICNILIKVGEKLLVLLID